MGTRSQREQSGFMRIRANWNNAESRKKVNESIDEAIRITFLERGRNRQLVRDIHKENHNKKLA